MMEGKEEEKEEEGREEERSNCEELEELKRFFLFFPKNFVLFSPREKT